MAAGGRGGSGGAAIGLALAGADLHRALEHGLGEGQDDGDAGNTAGVALAYLAFRGVERLLGAGWAPSVEA
jgi:hypothetical protein